MSKTSGRRHGTQPGTSAAANVDEPARLEDWERYTKGVGSKLLQKMGYKPGQGLGKDNEGIVEPVKLHANKGRSMLGLETEEREHRRREKAAKLAKHKGLRYESDDDEENESSEDDTNLSAPKFVQDDSKKEESESEIDENDPEYIAKQMIASNNALIKRLKGELREEKSKRSLLEQTMADHQRDLKFSEDILVNLRSTLNTIQHLETINRNDKLDIQNFWSFMTSTITPQTRSYMIQAFALPIVKKTYSKLVLKSQPIPVDERELEQKIFFDMIDIAREWLKTKACFQQLIDWYLDWSKLLINQYPGSKRIEHFRRKLLDVMFLATIKNERDLKSFRYIAFEPNASKQSSGMSEGRDERKSSSSHGDSARPALNFKQLVEQKALDNGLMFRPVNGRTHDSKQVYKLEKLNVYIDNRVIFVKKNDKWLPKTLDDVINMSSN